MVAPKAERMLPLVGNLSASPSALRGDLGALRRRLAELGPFALTDAELVALIIGPGLDGAEAIAIAERLIHRHGHAAGLAALPAEAFTVSEGIGPVRAARLAAAFELGRRRLPPSATSEPIGDEQAAGRLATALLGHERRERFGVLFLNTRNRLLAGEVLFSGSLDAAPVYPREIAARALTLDAAAVILAHNHPSGTLEPSDADRRVTRRVAAALELLDVEVHDHLICAGERFVSMRRLGVFR